MLDLAQGVRDDLCNSCHSQRGSWLQPSPGKHDRALIHTQVSGGGRDWDVSGWLKNKMAAASRLTPIRTISMIWVFTVGYQGKSQEHQGEAEKRSY